MSHADDRAVDKLYDAIEQAYAARWSARRFVEEMRQAWNEAAKNECEQKIRAMKRITSN